MAAYLAFERAATQRHEYVDGSVCAMSGASVAHNLIVGNIFARLYNHMLDQDCAVFASDMRLGLMQQESYFYPDFMVVCGDLQFADTQQDKLINPVLIIEDI